jgi:hypothetical protein
LALLLSTRGARADGAFPDSLGIMAPASRPHDIVLATNFGLVSSIDDGQTWTWACEQDQNSFGLQYQMGAPALDRLYVLANTGLAFSDDRACGWRLAGGTVAGSTVTDAFPDPGNPERVLAITASTEGDAGLIFKVVESSDAGTTFGPIRYTAAAGDDLTGIEISRSTPSTLYLTMISGPTYIPKLGRSIDGGASWQIHDLTAALGADVRSVRLIAVDPQNADRIFLRVGSSSGDGLAISEDGGVTAHTPLLFADGGIMSAFARTASGTLVAAGVVGLDPAAFRSTDGGQSFQPLPTPPNLRGLAARGDVIYGVADNVADGFAVGVSTDQGTSWQPLMRYEQIQAIDACVKTLCRDDCLARADMGQWPAAMCDATPVPGPVDGGSGSSGDASSSGGGANDGGGDRDAVGSDRGDAGGARSASSGCHCAVSSSSPRAGGSAAGLAGCMWLWFRRRRTAAGRARVVSRAG